MPLLELKDNNINIIKKANDNPQFFLPSVECPPCREVSKPNTFLPAFKDSRVCSIASCTLRDNTLSDSTTELHTFLVGVPVQNYNDTFFLES